MLYCAPSQVSRCSKIGAILNKKKNLANVSRETRCKILYIRKPTGFYRLLSLKSEGFTYFVYVVKLLPSEELYGDFLVALVA